MNISAVYDHIAGKLQTQVTVWSRDGKLMETWCRRTDLSDPLIHQESFVSAIFHDLYAFPLLAVVNRTTAYMIIPLENTNCLVGPVSLLFPENVFRQLQLEGEMGDCVLYTCSAEEMLDYGLLLFRLFSSDSISAYECSRRNYKSVLHDQALTTSAHTVYQFREEGQSHNPYEQEKRLMRAIEKGDDQLLEASQREQSGGKLGSSSDDPIRNGKNLTIALIAIASRACIRGGVDPEVAFTLSDSYMRQVEDLQGTKEMLRLPTMVNNMLHTMTKLVREIKESTNMDKTTEDEIPIINAVKKYVSRHLHEKLTVQDIALALSTHPNYLSSLFSREEGISLYQYILSAKLRTATHLLLYSQKPISEISTTLAFSSQSHFGKLFRENYEMTPKEYRDRFGQRKI